MAPRDEFLVPNGVIVAVAGGHPTPVKIAVHHRGARTGQSVLLVHGAFGNAGNFDFVDPELPLDRSLMTFLAEQGYDVYAVDLRGAGNSYRPSDYRDITIEGRASDVVAVATRIFNLRGAHKLVVIGHSAGAIYAAMLAANRPDVVRAVALLGTSGSGKLPDAIRTQVNEAIEHEIYRYDYPFDELWKNIQKVPETGQPTFAYDNCRAYWKTWDPDSLPLIAEVDAQSAFLVHDAFAGIHVPTLVMAGALDPGVGEAGVDQCFDLVPFDAPKRKVVLPTSGHALHVDESYADARTALSDFLSGVAPD